VTAARAADENIVSGLNKACRIFGADDLHLAFFLYVLIGNIIVPRRNILFLK
jgi:hypothetical protein